MSVIGQSRPPTACPFSNGPSSFTSSQLVCPVSNIKAHATIYDPSELSRVKCNTPLKADIHLFPSNLDARTSALQDSLHSFQPVHSGYGSLAYDHAFNWDKLTLPEELEGEWYCVVFRSRRNPSSSSISLYEADRAAHQEAVSAGGLVMYWYGAPDETGLNMATCIWQSRQHALAALSGPKHIAAMRQAAKAYEKYELERWVLSKASGQRNVSLARWQPGK